MIYCTVGNHYQPFDRLVGALDQIAPDLGQPCIAQIGHKTAPPRNLQWHRFIPYQKAEQLIKSASLVIAHAGIGTIIQAKKFGAPLIIVPRRKRYREHNSDHQMDIAAQLLQRAQPRMRVAEPFELFATLVNEMLHSSFPKAAFGTEGAQNIRYSIRAFIQDIARH